MSIPPFLTVPAGVLAGTIETDRGDFAVLDSSASGPATSGTALLVPGFTGSKEDFIALLEPLAHRGIRAVALDLAGQHQTRVPAQESISLTSLARGAAAVATALPAPLVLVGHSFGGHVVREMLLGHRVTAAGLVLIASGPGSVPGAQQEWLHQFAAVMADDGLEAVWQAMKARNAAAGVAPPPETIEVFLHRRFVANDPRTLTAMIAELCDATDRTAALVPVAPESLVVIGGGDDVWPLDEQREMAHRLGARVVELPDAGHSPAVDDPQAVAAAIASLQCFG